MQEFLMGDVAGIVLDGFQGGYGCDIRSFLTIAVSAHAIEHTNQLIALRSNGSA